MSKGVQEKHMRLMVSDACLWNLRLWNLRLWGDEDARRSLASGMSGVVMICDRVCLEDFEESTIK
jgi:hypothetical protein